MSTSRTNEERTMARAKHITVRDVEQCPRTSLSPQHYYEDGRCVCGEACRWFALCANEADTLMPHTVLGEVPICERCRTKVEAL